MPEKSIQELAAGDTTQSDVRGSSFTGYELSPVKWLKEINDAAQKRLFYAQFAYTTVLPFGTKDVVIPYRSVYKGASGFSSDAGEGVAVTFTTLDNLDGISITPTAKNAGVAISNHALRTNALDLIRAAREELVYHAGDRVDQAVRDALIAAADATNSVRGAQTVYGGDAVADDLLTAGDIMTTDLIADAKQRLSSTVMKYWSTGTETDSALAKNPWANTSDDPFVLFINSYQENAFLKDSQFVNAAEYGSNEVIMNGEIGRYLGVKIVNTENTKTYAIGDTAPDYDAGTLTVAMTRCIMCKPRSAVALAWGLKPRSSVFDYESQLEKRIILEHAWASDTIHDDAIVFLDVANE